MKGKLELKGISHITGGGIVGNTKRILPTGLKLKIEWSNWDVPPIFKLIQEAGDITDEEMREVFNMGIGIVFIVSKENLESILKIAKDLDEQPVIIGVVE